MASVLASASSSKPIVAVSGATGKQGGSVINYLLKEKKFNVRALTRDPNSAAGKAMQARGVEVVKADFSDKASLDSALKGATYVFIVTQFWEKEVMSKPELEYEHGKNMADAAKNNKVQFVIYSSLANAHGISNKRLHVPHFTNKYRVQQYIEKEFQSNCAFVYPGFYMTNLFTFLPMTKAADGTQVITLPLRADVGLPLFDVEDTGYYVSRILDNPKAFANKNIYMTCGYTTIPQIVCQIQSVTGQKARYDQVPMDQFKHPSGEVTEMLQWFNDYGYNGGADISESLRLFPAANTWDVFLRQQKQL
jgi:uncharacterized protein YbjT (DUF2867 family)